MMRITDVMTRDVQIVRPDQNIAEAARMMDEYECGALPVAQDDRLIGMATDRDIVVRAIAQGKSNETKISEVMSGEIKYCFDDEDTDDVARNMSDLQVRRLPVVNRDDKRLVGIVTIGDLYNTPNASQSATEALSNITEPQFQDADSTQRQH